MTANGDHFCFSAHKRHFPLYSLTRITLQLVAPLLTWLVRSLVPPLPACKVILVMVPKVVASSTLRHCYDAMAPSLKFIAGNYYMLRQLGRELTSTISLTIGN